MKTFEIAVKKNRRKQRILTVFASVVTICLLGIGLRIVSSKLITSRAMQFIDDMELLESVAYPNSSTYTWSASDGDWWQGGIEGRRAKDIFGVYLDSSEYKARFTWFSTDWRVQGVFNHGTSMQDGRYNLLKQQKIAQFYNVNFLPEEGEVENKTTKELPNIKEMKNQLVEVAITFDKPYTLHEIKTMIPEQLKKNWYWIGTQSHSDTSWWNESALFGAAPEDFTREEIKNKDKIKVDEKVETKTVGAFLINLKKVSKLPGESVYNGVNPRDDIPAYLKKHGELDLSKEEDRNKLTFAGVILTGRSEDFAVLENEKWIYASSIGASIPNQPYYQLEKE